MTDEEKDDQLLRLVKLHRSLNERIQPLQLRVNEHLQRLSKAGNTASGGAVGFQVRDGVLYSTATGDVLTYPPATEVISAITDLQEVKSNLASTAAQLRALGIPVVEPSP